MDHRRICGPSLTETSLCGAYLCKGPYPRRPLMHHRHGNQLHLVSASITVAVVHVTGSWQRSVLLTRAVCCRHSNLLSEIHYNRTEIIGSVLMVIPLKCRIIYRVILNCFFFYELSGIYFAITRTQRFISVSFLYPPDMIFYRHMR